jgi:hypothetical protein
MQKRSVDDLLAMADRLYERHLELVMTAADAMRDCGQQLPIGAIIQNLRSANALRNKAATIRSICHEDFEANAHYFNSSRRRLEK